MTKQEWILTACANVDFIKLTIKSELPQQSCEDRWEWTLGRIETAADLLEQKGYFNNDSK